jgi:hypothetical protein
MFVFWDILGFLGWGFVWLVAAVIAVFVIVVAIVTLAYLIDAARRQSSKGARARTYAWRLNRLEPGKSEIVSILYSAATSSKAYLSVPGILAHPNHAEPLLPVLDKHGYEAYALHYAGQVYDRDEFVNTAAHIVRLLIRDHHTVVLDGISHGGQGVAYVMAALQPWERERVDVILHDAPNGVRTLKQVPELVDSYFLLEPGPAVEFVLGWVPKLFAKGGPKQSTVWTPSAENMYQLTGRQMTSSQYFEWAAGCAKRDLTGHSYGMWHTEIGDMIRAGREGIPMNGLQGARSLTYIAYANDANNENISHPAAVESYRMHNPNMRVIELNGTHAGFRDDVDGNYWALEEALPK